MFETGMVARGYDEALALQTFGQLEGFGSYGFPESHAPASRCCPTPRPG